MRGCLVFIGQPHIVTLRAQTGQTCQQDEKRSVCLLVLFGVCPDVRVCVLGGRWTFLLCSSMYERLCLLYYPPPQLAAQASVDSRGQGLLLLGEPEEDKLAEVILSLEGERLQSPAFHHMLSGGGTAGENQRRIVDGERMWPVSDFTRLL